MKAKIIFGSEVGTTKYVAELLKKRLDDHQFEVDLYQVGFDGFTPDIAGYDLLLFGSPTYFEGLLQSDMTTFTNQFTDSLSKYAVAVFVLGDRSYAHFCESAEVLERWVASHEGTLLVPTLKVDGYPENFDEFTTWVNLITEKLAA